MSNGTVAILNVGAGDTKLSFDPTNPAERIRAARIVADMLRRGYALLVEVGKAADGRPIYQRAVAFDEARCEYIIADFDPVTAAKADQEEAAANESNVSETEAPSATQADEAAPAPRRKGSRRRVDAGSSRSVAVARSAGG
jgi:hypothetical protein